MRVSYYTGCDFPCCCTYFLCLPCHTCQVGRELELASPVMGGNGDRTAQELILNIQNSRPCCQDNSCITTIPVQQQ
eukprot:UN27228